MSILKRLLPPLFLFLFSFCGCDQQENIETPVGDQKETDAFVQNTKLARSINLGNILEAPSEGEWGLTLEEEYFQIIAEAGFTAVRLPCRWSAHTDTVEPFAIDPEFLSRVDWAIKLAFENDLAIVVNIHHYQELMSAPHDERVRLFAMWKQISNHYKNQPDDLILELVNEPNDVFTPEIWNVFMNDLIDTIRTIDKTRTLMVGTANWGGIGGLNELVLPADSNLIITIHYYNPFHFTHQGAEWVTGSEQWLGTSWGIIDSDISNLVADFDFVHAWAIQHKRPIYVGEFGAYSRAELQYRYHWTQSVVRLCEERSFSWAYWEFATGFGAYDRETGEWNELLSALMQH